MTTTRRALGLGLALLPALPLGALAHGPTRKKVEESVEINAPPERVWAAIANFQDMGWHPAVERTEGDGGNAVDAKRRLTLKGGGTIDETLARYEPEKRSYFYRIAAVDPKVLPVTNYSATLVVTPTEGGRSRVEWRGAFYRGYPNNDPPPDQNDEAAIKAVTGIYRDGLAALKKRLEEGGA
jgi:hypothetical protein